MTGFACCAASLGFRAYILRRTNRLAEFLSRGSAGVDSYRELVREGRAPLWPLIMNYVFVPLGIAIMFGAILFCRN